MDKFKKLTIYRKSHLSEISSLHSLAVKAKTDVTQHGLFKVRYIEMDSLRDEFIKNHHAIISILLNNEDADFDAEESIRAAFLSDFFNIKAVYADLFDNDARSSIGLHNINASCANCTDKPAHIRLPPLELVKYDGDFKTFSSFIDSFNATVHNHPTLSNFDKFRYLQGTLEGAALSLIRNIPLAEENYLQAYNKLVNKYSSKRFHAIAYWSEIDNAKKVNVQNSPDLRKLLDTFSDNLDALQILGFPVAQWDFILVMMLLQRIDAATITNFEIEYGTTDVPKYQDLFNFLEKHCRAYDTVNLSFQSVNSPLDQVEQNVHISSSSSASSNVGISARGKRVSFTKTPFKSKTSSFTVNKISLKCPLCSRDHALYKCTIFATKTPSERYNFCKTLHLCFNCLSHLHELKSCKSTSSCRTCHKRHHTLLHFEKAKPSPQPTPAAPALHDLSLASPAASNTADPVVVTAGVVSDSNRVVLSTALIDVLDNHGGFHTMRCLLDCGSMSSFITEKAAKQLGLNKRNSFIQVETLGSQKSNLSNGLLALSLKPVGKDSPTFHTNAIVIEKICDSLPTTNISVDNWSHIKNIKLADPNFAKPGSVDVLLGAEIFSKILLNGQVHGKEGEVSAINTEFGYILMGRVNTCTAPTISSFFCNLAEHSSLDILVKKFWEIEQVPSQVFSSPEDRLCEEIYQNSHTRDSDGRYIVTLPFRGEDPSFPGIRDFAVNRFLSLERRLLKSPELYSQYRAFMKDYLDLKHMEPLSDTSTSSLAYYIPHHPVLKPNNETTRLRVVFNASAKLPSQTSLNEQLLSGPKLQKDIVTILLNFRLHRYVLCTDIKQMYRMILLDPGQRKYQRIIWRFDPSDSLQDFQLNTVTYGVSSAPYLALRTLLQLAADEGEPYPLAVHAIVNDTFVDDIVTGSDTLDNARILQHELISLLEKGQFQLRKWSSNEPTLLSHFPSDHLSTNPLFFDADSSVTPHKVLGLQWNPVSDCFSFSVRPLDNKVCTKRTILSELARVYDPLGFLSPVIFFAKHLIQRLWTCGLGWDEPPPDEILRVWNKFKSELPLLSTLQISRQLLLSSPCCELHGFSDSSEKGYAAVVYIRVLADHRISVYFITAKSKVAPLKRITIPRLELCAALLLSDLVAFVLKVYDSKVTFNKIFAWTDSQIALSWIKSSPHRWKTFVSNRVARIQDKIPPSLWFYIESKLNPADVASRGIFPAELNSHSLWFRGPSFLGKPESSWNLPTIIVESSTPLEEERTTVLFSESSEHNFIDTLLETHSSFTAAQRILAYTLRFIHNLRNPSKRLTDIFTTAELYASLLNLVKRTQQVSFKDELKRQNFSKPLRKLQVFTDDEGLLRVGGRLKLSRFPYSAKYPLLLPRHSLLTQRIIDYYHKKYLHAGPRTLQYVLSQSFWILSPRRAINSVLSKCFKCWKANPRPFQPPMADLPATRISQVKPFLHTGVDFAGPFFVTMSRHRGVKSTKAYLCLFVCFATKALHLELATDLSTETFLAALQRFVARRGRCAHLYSDCGTNFVGANKELKKCMRNAASKESIDWHFNPPSAPHMGGLWEAGVKAVKSHLTRVVGDQVLTYEEFYTVLVLIESILNSRPLCAMSSDVNDITALTPNHLLTLHPVFAIPVPDATSVPVNRLSRWQLLQRLHQDFWRRWHREYLHTLQQRSKWFHPPSLPPAVGDLVLIKAENASPNQWSLARILSLNFGADGVPRVAEVRTADGVFKRPLVKLCPMPAALQ